jgi:small subunit ribosomal protein S9
MTETEHPTSPETPQEEAPIEPVASSEPPAPPTPPPSPAPPAPEAPTPPAEPTEAAAVTPEPPAEPVEAAVAPPAAEAEAPAAEPKPPAATKPPHLPRPTPRSGRVPPDGHWWWGTGRRKAAVARVRVRPGTGRFVVNKKPYEQFFTGERDQNDLMNVLHKTNTAGTLDVFVNVTGGGFTGQAGAIVLGLARALRRYDESLEPILRDNNFLTRDPRQVERKKYGQPGARKRFQFSKR